MILEKASLTFQVTIHVLLVIRGRRYSQMISMYNIKDFLRKLQLF